MHPPFLPWLGLFETLRVDSGIPRFVEEHWALLRASASELGLKIDGQPPSRSLPEETGRWRWVLDAHGALTDFFAPEADSVPAAFRLALAPQRVGSRNWDARHKTLSYLTHWQARRAVAADEAVLLNEHGHLASGAMSNLFWVSGGKLHTPRHEAGCRRGVMRGWVMGRNAVIEGDYPATALDEAEEIFLTNSWIGIRPVVRWRERELAAGPVAAALVSALNGDREDRAGRPPGN